RNIASPPPERGRVGWGYFPPCNCFRMRPNCLATEARTSPTPLLPPPFQGGAHLHGWAKARSRMNCADAGGGVVHTTQASMPLKIRLVRGRQRFGALSERIDHLAIGATRFRHRPRHLPPTMDHMPRLHQSDRVLDRHIGLQTLTAIDEAEFL